MLIKCKTKIYITLNKSQYISYIFTLQIDQSLNRSSGYTYHVWIRGQFCDKNCKSPLFVTDTQLHS
jgi:hypothetical protein